MRRRPRRPPETPPRDDGDQALQRCQDALYRRLRTRPDEAPGRLRVVLWTADDARLAPDVSPLFELHQEADDLALLEVSRSEPALRTGRAWHCLVPTSLAVLRDGFALGASDRDRHWLLDTLEQEVRACFWDTAYDLFGPSAADPG